LSAAFSPDGKKVFTVGSGSKTARSTIFNHGTDREKTVTFNADDDGTARIWDADSDSANFGKELKQLTWFKDGNAGNMGYTISFSPDWKKFVAVHREEIVIPPLPDGRIVGPGIKDTIVICDAESGKVLQTLDVDLNNEIRGALHHDSPIFSPDGRKIVLHGLEERINRIYDVDSGRELQRFGEGFATRINFSPNGEKIIGKGLNRIAIWDVEALLRQQMRPAAVGDF
jgi:WD40 repeat protein